MKVLTSLKSLVWGPFSVIHLSSIISVPSELTEGTGLENIKSPVKLVLIDQITKIEIVKNEEAKEKGIKHDENFLEKSARQ
ncbi:hypothetical protein HPP92_028128 [Vanilla planifolia]|uniref:Uncharacterized protein n=1 Tax=Vanilla planifolia TaxID=51239 RepID=A0A835PAC5_VANPL|nr:hypothetical protein HPP92_028128 [Vanilla planifolia]